MTKKIISRTFLSLAISASLALTAANAGGKSSILDESIYDYSDDASMNYQASSSRQSAYGYDVKIVLDEAYHDYYDAGIASFQSKELNTKRAEFAAFEDYSPAPSSKTSTSDLPWVSEVY